MLAELVFGKFLMTTVISYQRTASVSKRDRFIAHEARKTREK